MHPILSLVLASLQADLGRVDRVAMNIANAQTVGYKREVASAVSFPEQVEGGAQPLNASAPVRLAVHTDPRPGTLQATGLDLDLALVGSGWFEVMTAQGPAYTRQGNFRLDASGRLVTQQGDPVMGTAGEIRLQHGAPVIDAAGRVFEGTLPGGDPGAATATPIAQLKVVQFDPGASIERRGDALVQVQAEPVLAAEGSVQVRQGFLENANVSPMQEMVQLMQTLRHLESMQKVAVGYDEMLATSIRRLGEGS
jgi:flagellar basal-body rod protein FlgG